MAHKTHEQKTARKDAQEVKVWTTEASDGVGLDAPQAAVLTPQEARQVAKALAEAADRAG